MTDHLNIEALIDKLLTNGITPEELIGRAVRNLYRLEAGFLAPRSVATRNSIRATIAYAKVLYDHGQRMFQAREYLLHRIKLLEVREVNLRHEISVLRGVSPKENISQGDSSGAVAHSRSTPDSSLDLHSVELLKDMELSTHALLSLSDEIRKKSIEIHRTDLELDGFLARTHGLLKDHDRGGTPPPKKATIIHDVDSTLDRNMTVPSQEDLGASSGRHGGAVPDAAMSSSSKGNPRMDAASVRGDYEATAAAEVPIQREDASLGIGALCPDRPDPPEIEMECFGGLAEPTHAIKRKANSPLEPDAPSTSGRPSYQWY